MDGAMTDSELASEMVKLLAQELKVVRAQLRASEAERRALSARSTGEPSDRDREQMQELATENETLKAENAALQDNVSGLQDELRLGQATSIKSEDGVPNALQYEESMERMREELAGLLAEREELVREKEDALKYQEKHSLLRTKYNQVKAQAHEYSEELNDFRIELSKCSKELGQVKKGMVTEIDFRDFLRDVPYVSVEGQLGLASIKPYSHRIDTKFHEDLTGICKGPYFINSHEIIWSPRGIALGLVIKPMYQYNPKINGGTWTKLVVDFNAGEQMDVCLLSNKVWHYLGTYERVGDQGAMTIAPDTLQHLHHKKVDYALKRTTPFPGLPPSQTQMVKDMYNQGIIKLQCFAIRCVSFNKILSQGLRNLCTPDTSKSSIPQSGFPIPMPSATSHRAPKRKQNPESMDYSTRSRKKH